jgi:hypothetical protein
MDGASAAVSLQNQNRWALEGFGVFLNSRRGDRARNDVFEKNIIGGEFPKAMPR